MLQKRNTKWYGWKADLPDWRDHKFLSLHFADQSDLRKKLPFCWDQGNLGSCTGHGIAGAVAFLHPGFMPSRLFIYYGERAIEGDVSQDNGAEVRDGIKVVHKAGVPPEKLWPYNIKKFAVKPPEAAYVAAKPNLITAYQRIETGNLNNMLACLSEGFPFVFGFTVYESFEGKKISETGIMPMPGTGEKPLGGHCVLAVGHDVKKRIIIVRNSWGTNWGKLGYFFMPFDYIKNSNLCDDFWTLRA